MGSYGASPSLISDLAARALLADLTNSTKDEDDDDPPFCKAECANGSLLGLGIICGLFGSIFINTGNNIQSVGLHQLQEAQEEAAPLLGDDGGDGAALASLAEEVDPSKSGVWRFGTGIFLTGSLLNFAAFAFAPASVLAPLESVQFVTNLMFSKFALGKAITRRMYLGTFAICAGTIVAVVSSMECEAERTLPRLIELYSENQAYWVYLGLTALVGIGTHLTHRCYELSLDGAHAPLPATDTVLPVTYAAFSALFGTGSVVQAKCLAVLLKIALEGGQAQMVFTHWFTYFCLLAWLALVAVWLYRMNAALGLYDPIFIVPLLQADFIIFAVVSGGLYFREFRCFNLLQWAGFVGGILIMVAGLFLLAPADSQGGGLDSSKVLPVMIMGGDDDDDTGEKDEIAFGSSMVTTKDASSNGPTTTTTTNPIAAPSMIVVRPQSSKRPTEEEGPPLTSKGGNKKNAPAAEEDDAADHRRGPREKKHAALTAAVVVIEKRNPAPVMPWDDTMQEPTTTTMTNAGGGGSGSPGDSGGGGVPPPARTTSPSSSSSSLSDTSPRRPEAADGGAAGDRARRVSYQLPPGSHQRLDDDDERRPSIHQGGRRGVEGAIAHPGLQRRPSLQGLPRRSSVAPRRSSLSRILMPSISAQQTYEAIATHREHVGSSRNLLGGGGGGGGSSKNLGGASTRRLSLRNRRSSFNTGSTASLLRREEEDDDDASGAKPSPRAGRTPSPRAAPILEKGEDAASPAVDPPPKDPEGEEEGASPRTATKPAGP